MTAIHLISAVLLSLPAAAQERPEIRAILLEEADRPAGAAQRGDAAWDHLERGVQLTRKARQILTDARARATGIDRPAEHWALLEKRLERLESAHRTLTLPAMHALQLSFTNSRAAAADVDLAIKERELYTQIDRPGGPSSAMQFDPNAKNIHGLRLMREHAEGNSVQAEELLEKASKRLEAAAAPKKEPVPEYLTELVEEAEATMARAVAQALSVAKAQSSLFAKNGPYAAAISATEAYGGADGRGRYEEAQRAKAVTLANEAKRMLVVNEYGLASRIEEVRTLDYMLDRFGGL